MLKVIEFTPLGVRTMVRFIEIVNETNFNPRLERTATPHFTVGEVWINPEYVISIREASGYKSLLAEGRLPTDLNEGHTFSSIITNNGRITETHVVVGSPRVIATRLGSEDPQLLKG